VIAERFSAGTTYELGTKIITEEEIVRFAREFDPQPIHLDPEAARETPFGGLIASGWHLCCIFVRSLVDGLPGDVSNIGGLGMDNLRWKVPVRPGDKLTSRVTVVELRPSQSKPEEDVIEFLMELVNQRGEVVWHATAWGLTLRGSPA
jgi:acyl dehydratase